VLLNFRDFKPRAMAHQAAPGAFVAGSSRTGRGISGAEVKADSASGLDKPPAGSGVVDAASGVRRVALRDCCISWPNRTLFCEHLNDALAGKEHRGRAHALLCLDLDGFSAIKDAHGRDTGDELLQIVGARLTHALRTGDMVSRIGDGEFACLLGALPSRLGLTHLACKLFDAVEAPLTIGDLKLTLRTSIGIAIYPADGSTAELLLENANTAMARAKEQETGYALFDESTVL
jgi:diguanylate cyclase (GGDEF)-like protein